MIPSPPIFHCAVENPTIPHALAIPAVGFVPFGREWLDRSIPARFAYQVAQSPEQVAIKTTGEQLTYADLNRAANRLAHVLLEERGPDPEPVALLLHDDIAAVIGLLGILKAGKFFVNLNPAMPPTSLQKTLKSIEPGLLITDHHHCTQAMALVDGARCGVLFVDDVEDTDVPTTDPAYSLAPNAYAQIVSTSGSTGAPKNVLVTHETLLHQSMIHINGYYITAADRLMVTTPLTFGSSLSDVFAALLGGATLYPIRVQMQSLTALIAWLKREEITIYHAVSTFYRRMVQLLHTTEHFPHLRVIKLGGETVHRVDLETFKQHFADHCVLRVGLAGTEANLIAWYFAGKETDLTTSTVPVGYAVADKEIALLDEAGNVVEAGTIGEIVVRSRFLSPGYWHDPDRTAANFRPDPTGGDQRSYHTGDLGRLRPDGMLEHLGRKDQMVKVRGYRVELEAIAGALLELPMVHEAVVRALDDAESNQRPVAYVVPHGGRVTSSMLHKALQTSLPDYMIPSHFIFLAALPLLPNGKVDRVALPQPTAERPILDTPLIAPRNAIDAQLVTLWQEILAIQPIGIKDDFFELGGNSLTLLRLATELTAHFGQEVPLTIFLQGSTIERLATLLQAHLQADLQAEPSLNGPSIEDAKHLERYLSGNYNFPQHRTRKQHLLDLCLPYRARVRLFRRWCHNPLIQKHFFFPESKLLGDFQRAIEEVSAQTEDHVTNALMRILIKRYGHGVLTRTLLHDLPQLPQLPQWLTIAGQATLDEALLRKRGVILVDMHTLFPSGILPIVLKQLGHANPMVYSGRAALQQNQPLFHAFQRYFHTEEETLVIAKFLSLQMDVAQRKLRAGGIVWIAPDGGSGSRARRLPIFGWQRAFSTGFAELALQTGATVIPVRHVIAANGGIQISFLRPFAAGVATTNREERIQQLMQQYVDFLEETWRLDPANVGVAHMRHFLQSQPKIDA